ncbi:MAG: OmpA family protein [Candidatus Kapabacteria bacterium]|nr:OmpA family protein [Ignavibacteriota bacterium]MCW5884419.1 OmpA family protein [Candidatus Kapabacteria bacterium]
MKLTGRYIVILLPFIILQSHFLSAEESREEAIFGLVHKKYSSEFIVFMENDSVYIPFEEALSFFKIFYNVNDNRRYSGYVNNSDSSFAIDFKTKEIIDISGNKSDLNDKLWFATDLQIYVRTDIFAKIFKLQFNVLFNSLSILVQSDYELPFMRAIRTNQTMESFTSKSKEVYNFPLISSNTFTLLNGGVLDYNLGTSQSANYQSYNFSGNLGLELLNGEFQYNIFGRHSSDQLTYQDRFRWRYLINSDWLESISIGNIQNMSIRTTGSRGFRRPFYNLRGVQLTNENYKMPNVFTDYIIEDVIEPDWTVELYLADQLYEVKRADLNGYYRFEIPVTYGMTNIKVKIYGTKGEFVTEERILNIPNQILVPGELKYSFAAGQDENTGIKLLEGTLNSGVFTWLSTSFTAIKEETTSNVNFINQTSINIFNNTLLNLTATNSGIYEAGIKLPNNKVGNFEVYYTYFDRNIQSTNQLSSINFIGSINRIGDIPLTFSLFGSRDEFKEWNTNNFYSTLNYFYRSLNLSIRHNLTLRDRALEIDNINQNMSINATYSINRIPKFIDFINRISLNASTFIEPSNLNINSISGGFQFQVMRNVTFNGNYVYYASNGSSTFRFGLNLNTQSLRSNSSADIMNGRDPVFATDMSGSLEFDSQNATFAFINSMGSSNLNGKSSVAVKFFVDKNYNGILDDDEDLIPDADFVLLDALAKKTKLKDYYVVTNLLPGTRYNLRVKAESLPSNSLIPTITELAFISKPYSYKSINIPCQQGGVIEGYVRRQYDSGLRGQGGIRIHISGTDNKFRSNVFVFSDGSYFFDGLLPGKYSAQIDSMQLAILKVKSNPQVIDFEIKASEFGDYISNLDFELINITELYKEEPTQIHDGKDFIVSDFDFEGSIVDSPEQNDNLQSSIENEVIIDETILFKNKSDQEIILNINNLDSFSEIDFPAITDEIKPGTLRPLFFQKSNTTFLAPGMKRYLDRVAEFMNSNPKFTLRIEGHSDNFGSLEDNFNISHSRSKEVVGYLVQKGINQSRLISTAYGSLRPISTNDTPAGRQKNMRVELTLISGK